MLLDSEQVYRPHNSYCLHVDPRAEPDFHKVVENIVSCYTKRYNTSNVFLHPAPIPVYRGHDSMLQVKRSQHSGAGT